jgi:hypothetical protein
MVAVELSFGGRRAAVPQYDDATDPGCALEWLSNTNYLTSIEPQDFNVFSPDAASCSSPAVPYMYHLLAKILGRRAAKRES